MEKRKFDLYVHGNIITKNYLASGALPDANIFWHVPYESVDLNHGIIVEGDLVVDSLYTVNKLVGCSGFLSGRGLGIFSEDFESAKGKDL